MFGVHYFIRIPSLCRILPWSSGKNCLAINLVYRGNCHQESLHGLGSWPALFLYSIFFLSFYTKKIFIPFFLSFTSNKKLIEPLLNEHFVFLFPLTRIIIIIIILIELFFLELKILVFEFVFLYLRQLKWNVNEENRTIIRKFVRTVK